VVTLVSDHPQWWRCEEIDRGDEMTPITAEQALYQDLLSIYARAGAEVTYETEDGKVKPYWPKRFLQAVKRSEKQGELFGFVSRLVRADEPSRGFFILKKAKRLDLTVEALISEREKPYYGEIDFAVVEAARRRLADHGYGAAFAGARTATIPEPSDGSMPPASGPIGFAPGTSFDVRITVGGNGNLSFALI
jgi:hypothetical protein